MGRTRSKVRRCASSRGEGSWSSLEIVAAFVGAIATVLAAVLVAWQPWASGTPVSARVTQTKLYGNAIVAKPIRAISRPPSYPVSQQNDHCEGWWRKWLPKERAADFEFVPQISIAAPAGADVAVTNVSVHVFSAQSPNYISAIACRVSPGAGPEGGTKLLVDLDHPTKLPTIVPTTGGRAMHIPSGVINIAPGHTEYVEVDPEMDKRYYEWALTLELSVDQRVERRSIGSRQNPLRSWRLPIPNRPFTFPPGAKSWHHPSSWPY